MADVAYQVMPLMQRSVQLQTDDKKSQSQANWQSTNMLLASSARVHKCCTRSGSCAACHGMSNSALQTVYRSVVVQKLIYASSAWWGFSRTITPTLLLDLVTVQQVKPVGLVSYQAYNLLGQQVIGLPVVGLLYMQAYNASLFAWRNQQGRLIHSRSL